MFWAIDVRSVFSILNLTLNPEVDYCVLSIQKLCIYIFGIDLRWIFVFRVFEYSSPCVLQFIDERNLVEIRSCVKCKIYWYLSCIGCSVILLIWCASVFLIITPCLILRSAYMCFICSFRCSSKLTNLGPTSKGFRLSLREGEVNILMVVLFRFLCTMRMSYSWMLVPWNCRGEDWLPC